VDFSVFQDAGQARLEGSDPYQDPKMLSPPTAVPVFAIVAMLPRPVALPAWTALNLLLAILLVPVARTTLSAQGFGDVPGERPDTETWLLMAAMTLSLAVFWGIGLGQVAILEAMFLFGALYCQGRGWPILAGLGLGLATIKPHTMLPALLLFCRREDWKSWASLTVVAAGLCLASGPVESFSDRLREDLRNIAALSEVGAMNDYSFAGPHSHTVIGLDRAAYCLGVRDRTLIKVLQFAGLGLLGAGLGYGIIRGRLGRPSACALVMLYTMIFLYHRIHDATILALPMIYSGTSAVASEGRRRKSFALVTALLLLLLFIHPKLVEVVVQRIPSGLDPARRIAEGMLLPYTVWFLLAAIGLILREEWGRARASVPGDEAGRVGLSESLVLPA
jgi:hypothetical protein